MAKYKLLKLLTKFGHNDNLLNKYEIYDISLYQLVRDRLDGVVLAEQEVES
jgi:hypothetical protein